MADEVFFRPRAQGIAIIPEHGQVYAPFAGTVLTAFPTGHAFGIKSADGVEALIHIGIDTVELEGEGFTAAVSPRTKTVEAGDLLATFDLAAIKAKGDDLTTPVITSTAKSPPSIGGRRAPCQPRRHRHRHRALG